MSNFTDKVVLVTGAAGGFGRLLAERLAARGARLVLGDIKMDGLALTAGPLGERAVAQACDVTREADLEALAQRAVAAFGRLDIAVNNAGVAQPMKGLLETTGEELERMLAVNTKSVLFGMKHQIPPMLAQGGGAILNVASMAGLVGAPQLAAYAAAKHAVVGLTRSAALEFAAANVRVNAICPFFSPTPLVTDGIDTDVVERIAHGAPMKRLGTPEEMVSAMLHLIDPDNSYMTGQAIAVDGGVSAR